MLTVSELFIYPIKSLGGISVPSAALTSMGFQFDRRWMLVDENSRFLSQRELPEMALLQVEITNMGLRVLRKLDPNSSINIPLLPFKTRKVVVEIFEDHCEAVFVSGSADEWFSEILSIKCRLVFIPDSSKRLVDKKYAFNDEITGFADAFPYLLIGQSSLDDLNQRLENTLPVNRFRPNIVFTGGRPYEEDVMNHFVINEINFYGVKPCARCVSPTINQDNGLQSKEPLQTLATYRKKNNKIYFGQNLLAQGRGVVAVGDNLKVIKTGPAINFNISQNS
jgi:uncharacterized protein YcbX